MNLSPETLALVKRSNELATVVQELEAQKKRGWESYHVDMKREYELEAQLLAGDQSAFKEWADSRRRTRAFMTEGDVVDAARRKARDDYNKAHEGALAAIRKDAGLVWVGF